MGSAELIRRMAARTKQAIDGGQRIVVVVSAMGSETDRLAAMCDEFASPSPRERDSVLACGEQISSALAAMALQEIGVQIPQFYRRAGRNRRRLRPRPRAHCRH